MVTVLNGSRVLSVVLCTLALLWFPVPLPMGWQPKVCQETGSQGRSLSKQGKGEEGVNELKAGSFGAKSSAWHYT